MQPPASQPRFAVVEIQSPEQTQPKKPFSYNQTQHTSVQAEIPIYSIWTKFLL